MPVLENGANISVITELSYTVTANTCIEIAAKQSRRLAKYPRFFVLWSQSKTANLKSTNRLKLRQLSPN